jgi:hypothetical protein
VLVDSYRWQNDGALGNGNDMANGTLAVLLRASYTIFLHQAHPEPSQEQVRIGAPEVSVAA